ncbi:hypothetical protein [Microbacterium sp. GXF7504]
MSTPTHDDEHNIQGTPGGDEEADTASGGSPDSGTGDAASDGSAGSAAGTETTDDEGRPLDNPSGG